MFYELLASWWIAVRSLEQLRPAEFAAFLSCWVAAGFSLMLLGPLGVPPALCLSVWLLPPTALYWIGRRRSVYARRKVRRLAGEDICLDCGYLVNEPGASTRTITICPECGCSLDDHSRRAKVRIPESFVFPQIERASSDAEAREWLRIATSRGGWLGKHRRGGYLLALVGVAVVLLVVRNAAEPRFDRSAPGSALIPLIPASAVVALCIVKWMRHRLIVRALESFRSQCGRG